MYKSFIRPLFFLFPPERVHHFVSFTLKVLFVIPGMKYFLRKYYCLKNPTLERKVFGLHFSNPVGFAAGFDKKADLYNYLANFGFSHIEIGTVTPRAQRGNPRPRLFRLKKDNALINRMGFNNPGLDKFVNNLRKNKPQIIIGGNIGKNTDTPNENAVKDYCECFNILYDYVDYFVVNVSCPNISNLNKLADKDNLLKILNQLQELNNAKIQRRPVLLKISPDLNTEQLDDTIRVVEETKLDGIIAANTTIRRDNLKTNQQKIINIGNGGLSGKPLTDKSTEVIAYIHKKTKGKIPIIGVGGIHSPEDAVEKLNAGASLIQLYTGYIYEGPSLARKINKRLLSVLG